MEPIAVPPSARIAAFYRRFLQAINIHPRPIFGYAETLFWLVLLISILDHLRSANSPTGTIIWYLTIGPHEMGHVVCIPFGQILYIAGGSFWQVMFWALLGLWVLLARRQLTGALLMWAITGHSFINLARYIGDARARQLPLLFGLGTESHDWWNLLSRFNLLDADSALATLSAATGALIVLTICVIGIVTAWMIPQLSLGPRFPKAG